MNGTLWMSFAVAQRFRVSHRDSAAGQDEKTNERAIVISPRLAVVVAVEQMADGVAQTG